VKTVTLEVRDANSAMAASFKAWRAGRAERSARISFATPELLWKVLTAKRWELLKVLCGAGPASIREAARRADRDVKAVHGDVMALLNAGVLDRTEAGEIVFPYDAVKVEFVLQAASLVRAQNRNGRATSPHSSPQAPYAHHLRPSVP
jgi:predicted transcriptional regulator